MKEKCDEAFYLFPDDDYYDMLFTCGCDDIVIYKEDRKSESRCQQNENSRFDYRGVEKALVQNPRSWNGSATPKRFIVIQMN